MRKTKAFGCIVVVIASMIVFSLVNVPTEAITYPRTNNHVRGRAYQTEIWY